MLTKKTIIKVISGVVIGGTILSMGVMAFADNVTTNTAGKLRGGFPGKPGMARHEKAGAPKGPGRMMPGTMQDGMKGMLDELVKSGSITQDKADKIKEYMAQKENERKAQFDKFKSMTPEERKAEFEKNKDQVKGNRVDLFADVVAKGILTQAEADNIKSKIAEINQNNRKKSLEAGLTGLVGKGTINNEQKDKILNAIDTREKQIKEVMDKIKGMAPDERRQYMKDNASGMKDPISQLVDDGTITKEQAQEIGKVIGRRGPGMPGERDKKPGMRPGFDKGGKRPAQNSTQQQ